MHSPKLITQVEMWKELPERENMDYHRLSIYIGDLVKSSDEEIEYLRKIEGLVRDFLQKEGYPFKH